MLRNPYFQLICAIFRVINALRNRNDSFDCHALTSQSKVSTHAVQCVGMYACTGNRKYDPYTCIGPPQIRAGRTFKRACSVARGTSRIVAFYNVADSPFSRSN